MPPFVELQDVTYGVSARSMHLSASLTRSTVSGSTIRWFFRATSVAPGVGVGDEAALVFLCLTLTNIPNLLTTSVAPPNSFTQWKGAR